MRNSAVFLASALLLAACGGGTGAGPASAPLPPQGGAASGGNPQTATVAKTYTVVDLGANFRPTALNNHNDVVGFDWFNGTTQPVEAALYSGGTVHNLGTLPGATGSMANGIDDTGTIIGTATGPGANQTAALFSAASAPQSLGTGNGAASSGNAINSTGELVGTVYSASDGSSGTCYNQIAIFDGHGGAQQYASNALAVGVNKSGSIVYDIYNGISLNCREGTISVAMYPGNATIPYPANASNDNGTSGAMALNDNGDVVGFYRDSNFNNAGFYYHNGSSIELLPAGYENNGGNASFNAQGINNSDVIVGTAQGNDGTLQGFAWADGTFANLNAHLAAGCAAWTIEKATAINDEGDIVGVGAINHQEHGILLIPQS